MSHTAESTAGTDTGLGAVTLLDVQRVAKCLGLSSRTVWRLSALAEAGRGVFPKPVRLGSKLVRWRLRDIQAYLATLAGDDAAS